MRRFLKWCGATALVIFLVVWVASGYVGTNIVTAPSHRAVKPRNEIAGKAVEPVSITTDDGIILSAWYVPNGNENAVVTLHGISANRGQMVSTAETYINWGFSALLPDLRGSGESQGDLVSIGYHERRDLAACVRWLRDKGLKTIGAHGFSLGAATVCFSMKELPELGFAVVESGYDTMRNATNRRLDLVHMPHFIGWPWGHFLGWRLGTDFSDLAPVKYVTYAKCPTLVMSGDNEGVLTPADTTVLYDQCGAKHKMLHLFKDGHHQPSISRFPDESRNTLRQFLKGEVGCNLP